MTEPRPATPDHQDLIMACARGEKSALQALYALEAGRMIAVAQRILQRRDWAEDAVHDTFVQIWRKAAQFQPGLGSARGWVYTILRHLSLNMRRDRAQEEAVDPDHLAALAVPALDPAAVFADLAETSALKRCLQALEAPRRDSIILAYAGGFSHGEIAGRLGVPLGTVKAWIRRGLLALRACLA
ncbi:sigma-70 family RNA polymerase sigma factor [Zavarzinia compransoris]|uniref:sigma-70 family RNA polymerase sigma factor n=1 Tax=Zavarzinia compransoris TaxID=1264899 RepID=UPI001AAD713A|nr:sigma-70 family RNA polymerase sigma factor [Zavarzinia compransoris]